MAEVCKDCFKNKMLTLAEQMSIKDEQIVMFDGEDFCECCGQVKPVVHYVKELGDEQA